VNAGASFGTSIRGLGQLNEQTKEVENYDFLGCDAVGNPSAGTFASKEQFEVTVESAPSTLVRQVTEQLEDRKMPSFVLTEKIDAFKQKHFVDDNPPKQVTQDMTADLLGMQREAVNNAVDTEELDTLFNEIFGEPSAAPKSNGNGNGRANNYVDRDIHNRTVRELEATQNLAVSLQDQVKELETLRDTAILGHGNAM
jgi:hypothetical protein